MVRPGAVVVDVGMNRLPDGKLAGDVDFEAVAPVASAITPGARRRRADDDHHAAAQHAPGGQTAGTRQVVIVGKAACFAGFTASAKQAALPTHERPSTHVPAA